MKTQTEFADFQPDIMTVIQLLNSNFEVNQELVPVVLQAAQALGLSDVKSLISIPEKTFFAVFTPMMNKHYGLAE